MAATPLPFAREETGPAAGVVTITLESPGRPVVILNKELFERLDATLDAIGATAKGLVLASASERAFVAGADLKEISSFNDDALDDYLALGQRVMGRIAHMHCTTIAAINGPTLGGGLELALHCDMLVACLPNGGKDYMIGLPEATLGLCPGWGGASMLPARMDPAEAIRLAASGKTVPISFAREANLIEMLLDDPSKLLPTAKEMAASLLKEGAEREPRNIHEPEWREPTRDAIAHAQSQLPKTKAAHAVVLSMKTCIDLGWEAAQGVERHLLIHLRKTPEARDAIQSFLSR
ncbi:MAG: enoyl-CoA hydratase/isomerase family protein [Phycisphaerales bacterium]